MIDTLPPYPDYKDSDSKWFGHVPAHWPCVPLFAVASPKSMTNCPDRELLSVYLNRGVVRFSDIAEKRTNVTSSDLSKYTREDLDHIEELLNTRPRKTLGWLTPTEYLTQVLEEDSTVARTP